jgi:lipopolysaccharide assembly outer membrane protein LptD (OstA)
VNRLFNLHIIVICLFVIPLLAVGQDSTKTKSGSSNMLNSKIDYLAKDTIQSFLNKKLIILRGQANIKYENIELSAAHIEIDFNKNEVYAKGRLDSLGNLVDFPIFKEGSDVFESKEIRYNFKTQKGIITDVITEQDGGFLHSKRTKKHSQNVIDLKSGKYTTCDHEHPHYYIALTKARVIQDEKIVSGPLYMVIADIPTPVFIPFGFFPFTKERASGIIIPSYGESKSQGFHLQDFGYYWATNEYMDLTVLGTIHSFGGWKALAQSTYKKRYRFNGNVLLSYENIELSDPLSPDYVNTSAYQFTWHHAQDPKARPNSSFNANVNLRSTSANRYSNNADQYLQNTVQSTINYSNDLPGTPFRISSQFSHTLNTRDSSVSMKLPNMTLSMDPITPFMKKNPKGAPKWYEKITLNYNGTFDNAFKVKEENLFKSSIADTFKFGVKHNASANTSIKVLKYFSLNPSINYTERWYFKSIRKEYDESLFLSDEDTTYGKVVTDTLSGFNRVYDYYYGANLSTTIYGMYTFKPFMPIEAIRFVHKPSIGFSYNPDFSGDEYGYYGSFLDAPDDEGLREFTEYSYYPSGIGIYGNASSSESGRITMALKNVVEMKIRTPKDTASATKKISIFDQLNFSTAYDLMKDSLNWSNLAITANTRLFDQLNLNISATLDPYALDPVTFDRINKFEWSENHKIGRLTDFSISTSYGLSSETFKDDEQSDEDSKPKKSTNTEINYYNYFEIPWQLNLSYSYVYSKRQNVKNITQTLRLTGNFSVTKKWKVGFSSGYDFEMRKMSYTTLNIERDLHCWMMRFSWVPFGERQSYSFTINVKAAMLRDALKYDKRQNPRDNYLY